MTPRTTTAEDGVYVQRLGGTHFAHLRAVIEDLSPRGRIALPGRRHAGQLRRLLLLARAVTQSQTANDRDQSKADIGHSGLEAVCGRSRPSKQPLPSH